MLHSDLILTLVAAFVAAFLGGLIASRLGLPPIVGYLLAGVAIGPYTPGGSASSAIAADLAEVGVVLLMFGVGLHFSVRELLSVGRIAIPGALGQSAVATLLGLGVTQLWGWSLVEGLIFGLCLSVASTVVLLRALEDRNLIESHSGRVAVGWLIMEDVFTVLILVLLPAFADSNGDGRGLASVLARGNPSLQVVLALCQAALFVFLMLFVGPKAIPRLLSEVVRSGSRELFTLCILAMALGLSFGSAELFGTSLALGAFLAGIILNESDLSHRAGLEALPLRDAFAVLFFVSVGMLFDPAILLDQPFQVLQVLAIIVAGKAFAAFLIVTVMGYGLRTGLVVSAALAQIGEFSFILAALAGVLGLLPQDATSLILAGAILSITLNPFIFGKVDRAAAALQKWGSFKEFAERRYPEGALTIDVRRHLVICGYGRSGSILARILSGRRLPFVIIENDPFVVQRARDVGYTCVFGDASQPIVLQQAQIGEARALAVTFGNQPAGAMTVQTAQTLNPGLNVVARGSAPDAHLLLRQAGAAEVVDPDLETSLEFVRHVLRRFGIESTQIAALQMQWRQEHARRGVLV
jgi:CPA2 family monovalent cation:H+ antiporter-2